MRKKIRSILSVLVGVVLLLVGVILGRMTKEIDRSVAVAMPTIVTYDGSQYTSIAFEDANRALQERIKEFRHRDPDSGIIIAAVVPLDLGTHQIQITGFRPSQSEVDELIQLAADVLSRHERVSRLDFSAVNEASGKN